MAVTLESLNTHLETILKEQKSLRKVVNTIRQHIEDPAR